MKAWTEEVQRFLTATSFAPSLSKGEPGRIKVAGFRDLSISEKLTLIIMATSGAALLLAGASCLIDELLPALPRTEQNGCRH